MAASTRSINGNAPEGATIRGRSTVSDGLEPELLAHHFTEAGLSGPAVDYWSKAGERALERSAYAEAVGHLDGESSF
jgi:predicted ATPase